MFEDVQKKCLEVQDNQVRLLKLKEIKDKYALTDEKGKKIYLQKELAKEYNTSRRNIVAAMELGIQTHLLSPNDEISDLF